MHLNCCHHPLPLDLAPHEPPPPYQETQLPNPNTDNAEETSALSIAISILTAVNSAADIFPPLKTVTSAVLYIAQEIDVRKLSAIKIVNLMHFVEISV